MIAVARRLLLVYTVLLPLRRLYFVDVLGPRVQLTELVFLLLGPLLLLTAKRVGSVSALRPVFVGLLIYLGALSWSTLAGGGGVRELVELAGRYYLLLLFVGATGLLVEWREGPERVLLAWRYGVCLLALSAYVGVGLALAGWLTPLVEVYENYPYFGTLFRVRGVAGGATAFVALCIPVVVDDWLRYLRRESRWPWLIIVLSPVLLLTFSKELVLLVIALLVATPAVRARVWLMRCAVVTAALFYWSVTHYLIQSSAGLTNTAAETEVYSSGHLTWQGPRWRLLETSYLSLKRAALVIGAEHPLVGVGADGFPKQLPELKARGVYPTHLPDYIPHSTWFGTWAEAGGIGLLGLLILCAALGRTAVKLTRNSSPLATSWVPVVSLLALGVGSINMDLMHLRFTWLLAALLLGMAAMQTRAHVTV